MVLGDPWTLYSAAIQRPLNLSWARCRYICHRIRHSVASIIFSPRQLRFNKIVSFASLKVLSQMPNKVRRNNE